jgi:ParB family chromosome partitioning protein
MSTSKKEKPKHLGRGLQSLLGPIKSVIDAEDQQAIPIVEIGSKVPSENQLRNSLRDIKIDSILPNPYQPRNVWDDGELEDLAESIKAKGVIQPVIVRQAGDKFELIAGERRFRAAAMIPLDTIPAVIRMATDEEMLELALIENIHRTNLNPIERAQAYKSYLEGFSLTQAEAAEKLGENRSVIANHLRLLELPDEIKHMLIAGNLSMGHARAILALPTDDIKRKLANRAMVGRLSVREVEKLVRKQLTGTSDSSRALKEKPAHILDLEDKLTRQLGTKVSIDTRKNGNRGKIVIEFFSLDEFDRITEMIGIPATEQV